MNSFCDGSYRVLNVAGWDHEACEPIDPKLVGYPLDDLEGALEVLTHLLERHFMTFAGRALVIVGPDGELLASTSARMAVAEGRMARMRLHEIYRLVEPTGSHHDHDSI
jgi:hypothetical protein